MDMNNIPEQPTFIPEEKPSQEPSKSPMIHDLLDYLGIMVLALCLVISLFSFSGLRLCTVDGDSMLNTLYNGERLVTWGLFYSPQRNDIIVFHQTSQEYPSLNKPIVKRVIGLPGDTVFVNRMNQKATVIDDQGNIVLSEEGLRGIPNSLYYSCYPVDDDHVFVMGDNREDSQDSRSPSIGFIDEREILGKAIFLMIPGLDEEWNIRDFNRIGVIG